MNPHFIIARKHLIFINNKIFREREKKQIILNIIHKTKFIYQTNAQMNGLETSEFHCPISSCNQIDFLPFECKFCGIKFCSNHRTQESHQCSKAEKTNNFDDNSKIILKTQRKCAKDGCQVKLSLVNEYECKKCRKFVCLQHRFEEAHECGKSSNKKQSKEKKNKGEKKDKNNVFSCFWVCCKTKKLNKI